MNCIPVFLGHSFQVAAASLGLAFWTGMAPVAHAQDFLLQRCSITHQEDAHGVGVRDLNGHCHWTMIGAELANARIRKLAERGGRGTQTADSGQIMNDARKLMNTHSLATKPGPGPIAAAQARDEDACRRTLEGLGEDASQCSDPGQARAIAAARVGSNLAMNGSPAAGLAADPGRTGCHKLLDKLPFIGKVFGAYHTYEDYHAAVRPPPDPRPTLGANVAADCR